MNKARIISSVCGFAIVAAALTHAGCSRDGKKQAGIKGGKIEALLESLKETVMSESGGPGGGGSDSPGGAKEAKAEKRGLNDPGSDSEVVAEAKKVLKCDPERLSICEAYKGFLASDLIKGGRADKTLSRFTEDKNPSIRYLGASALLEQGIKDPKDKDLAGRAMGALEREKDMDLTERLARTVAMFDWKRSGIEEMAVRYCREGPVVGRTMMLRVAMGNNYSPALYEVMKKAAATDPDADLRAGAVTGFANIPADKHGELCKLWVSIARTDKDAKVVARALEEAVGFQKGGCKDHYDELLALITKSAESGSAKEPNTAWALAAIHRQKVSTAAQKERALDGARALLANKSNAGIVRSSALSFLCKTLPKSKGKALAKNHIDPSEEFFVRTTAENFLAGKKHF